MLVLTALFALAPHGWAQDGRGGPEETHGAAESGHATEQGTHAAGLDDHATGGHGDHHDAGMKAAAKLAVGEPPSWYSKVVTGAIVLFVLAATLGSVAVLTKAPEPQEPDHHNDHGHGHDHSGHGHH
jgi:hypothetical protein